MKLEKLLIFIKNIDNIKMIMVVINTVSSVSQKVLLHKQLFYFGKQ